MRQDRREEIESFMVQAISRGGRDVAKSAAQHFGISRQAANQHLQALVRRGVLEASGRTRGRVYVLKPLAERSLRMAISPGLAEDRAWRQSFSDALASLPENVLNICYHGFTEMFNNAVEHSGGQTIDLHLTLTAAAVEMLVGDDGIGIFRKIKEGLRLEDEREAILELSKGKATTDPERHTGEGVFFTSRMFDEFVIESGRWSFRHHGPDDDWLIEGSQTQEKGTRVRMKIATRSARTAKEVFDRYAPDTDGYGFTKTHVLVHLLQTGQENLVSRSQAKRLLVRLDRFQEVTLDFHGVAAIGQAFADEVFRVFRRRHPQVRLLWVAACKDVEQMIHRATAAFEEPGHGT